jgi:transposase
MTDSDRANSAGREDGGHKGSRHIRQWPIAKKCRIVEETFVPGASVSIVARRHDVNANLVFGWRKQYRQGTLVDKKMLARTALPAPDLVRVGVVDQEGSMSSQPVANGYTVASSPEIVQAPPESRASSTIEIELSNGTKMRVDASIDETALRRVLTVIRETA